MISTTHLRTVINDSLTPLELYCERSEILLLGTAATESLMGTWFKQVAGPALSVYCIEPATYAWLWKWLSERRPELLDGIKNLCGIDGKMPPAEYLCDLQFGTIMARIKYLTIPEKLPEANDIKGMASYWKRYYNTVLGKGTEEGFLKNYALFFGGE